MITNSEKEKDKEKDEAKKSLDSVFTKGLPSKAKRIHTTGNAAFEMNLSGLTDNKPFG